MKTKYILIVSLILAILTIGAVSASEDVAVDDAMAASDVTEDPIEEASADENTLGEEVYVEGFEVDYMESAPVDFEDSVIEVRNDGGDVEGNITVSVDNKLVYEKEFIEFEYLDLEDLNITSPKEYGILVNFVPVTGTALTLANYTLIVTEKEADIGIEADINSFVDVSYTYEYENYLAEIDVDNDELKGNITLYLDGELYYNKTIESGYIGLSDLIKNPAMGKYFVELKYYDGEKLTLIKSGVTKIDYYMQIDDLIYGYEMEIGSDIVFDVNLPSDATGSLYVVLNGKEYKVAYKGGEGTVTISTNDLDVGKKYNVDLVLRNDPKYPDKTETYEVTTIPKFDYPEYMGVGETDIVCVALPGKYAGTLYLYNAEVEEYEEGYTQGSLIASAAVVNGKASIKLYQPKEGLFYYIAEYVNGNYSYRDYIDIRVDTNNKNISATVEPATISAGGSVTLKLTGPKDLNENFEVYVDGVRQDKYLNFFNLGSISQSIKFTTVGEHSIKVLSSGVYSNTFFITVKAATPAKDVVKLTLKKVKVKKSAKKLVLQATLKINGKAVKGKVIKFKFNKKTYKAKTNKKGVAKVTVKKAVLKKLKVGKKVKIQATYGKTTKKLTVKVKK